MLTDLTNTEVEELRETNQRLRRENQALRRELDGHVLRTEDPVWSTLMEVYAEIQRQQARYGDVNAQLPDGTGADVQWLDSIIDIPATRIETVLRREYEKVDEAGELTWMHLVREEIAEAFQEDGHGRLRAELIQVAGLSVNWASRR